MVVSNRCENSCCPVKYGINLRHLLNLHVLVQGVGFRNWKHISLNPGFPGGSPVQGLQQLRVWSLGWEDPLEEGMAAHPSVLAWTIPWAEAPGRPQIAESQGRACTHA